MEALLLKTTPRIDLPGHGGPDERKETSYEENEGLCEEPRAGERALPSARPCPCVLERLTGTASKSHGMKPKKGEKTMPDTRSFPKLARDWESLMTACKEHPEIATMTEPLRLELEALLADGKTLADKQASFKAQGQRATQELKDAVKKGKELARRIRRAAPFTLGTDNEELVRFKVKPLRPRVSRKKGPEVKPPVPTPDGEPAQTTGAKPSN